MEYISREEHADLQRRVDRVETAQEEDKRMHLNLAESQGRIEEGIKGLTNLTQQIVNTIEKDVQNLAVLHRSDVEKINDRIDLHVVGEEGEVQRLEAKIAESEEKIATVKDEMAKTIARFLTWVILAVGLPILGLIGEQIFSHVFHSK